jgi:uncharacterized membrane protein
VYELCVVLHLLAAFTWLGHMVFWSIVVGPVAKRLEAGEAERLRAAIGRYGGLGWPALTVLAATGLVLLMKRGLLEPGAMQELTGDPSGQLFLFKLALVAGMVLFQWKVGHRPAPKLIYLNILAAFLIVGASVLLVRHPELGLPG